jgi:hypothetical protein
MEALNFETQNYHTVSHVGLAVLERLLDGGQLLGVQRVHILVFHMPTPSSATTVASYEHWSAAGKN